MSERKNFFFEIIGPNLYYNTWQYVLVNEWNFFYVITYLFIYLFIYCYYSIYSISLQIDHSRRIHDYDPFIRTFLTMLAEQGHLAPLVEQQSSYKRRLPQTKPHLKQLKRVYKRKKPR